jgi:CRP-like cAMP-binding protein
MDEALVSSIPLFASLGRRERTEIARLTDELDVPAGAELTGQGEYAREFFVIREGTADVTRDGEHVATLGAGDFFGEIALLDSGWRTATVVAATPMKLLVMAPQEFRTLMHGFPAVADCIKQAVEKRR